MMHGLYSWPCNHGRAAKDGYFTLLGVPAPGGEEIFDIPVEKIRRDQKALLYKPVPAKYNEISVFFYDKAGNKIEGRLNLKRGERRKTFCYRTLQRMDDPRWNHVFKIVTYSKDEKIRRSKDHRITGSEDQWITGSEDPGIKGSRDQRVRGSEDQTRRSKD